ncbi:dihydrodiol dehydrogenase [Streptomyces sp. NPDC127079]|uniref:dihydrodiol dehydrogenase n=1 Tax=Streptomyces sp. NPDC127079 TaxID=3347132 RepID=UPI0036544450
MPENQYSDDPPIQISNEFADIRVRKVYTRNGERLEIHAHRRGYRILLDAVELESLTWQTPETFSGFLRASVGRDVDDE